MSAARKAAIVTPIEVLRNCRGKAVSIELTDGETINGIVMRSDRAMNVVLKQCIRTSASGDAFWRAREFLVRGASVRNVRMDESALRVATAAMAKSAAAGKRRRPHKQAQQQQQQQARTTRVSQPSQQPQKSHGSAVAARLGKRTRADA